MNNKRFLEVSVKSASSLLGVTERSIINYIKDRRIIGTKVGKEWFVDRASIEVFALKYGFELNESSMQTHKQNNSQLEVGPNSQTKPILNPISEHPTDEVYIQSISEDRPTDTKPKQQKGVQNLRAFLLLKKTLVRFPDCYSEGNPFKEKLNQLSYSIIENLGSGFHAYEDQEKVWYYQKARAGLGALIAVSKMITSPTETETRIFNEIEFLVLPATSSLIRMIESGNYKKDILNEKATIIF